MAPVIEFRSARVDDLPAIVALLADDALGAARESAGDLAPYREAFAALTAQKGNAIIVGEDKGEVVACLQLTIVPGLSRRGATRAFIESVRVAGSRRGQRIGEAIVAFAIEKARAAGCRLIQLTSDKSRTDAHRFYERLGFKATHIGMKLELT
jgi:ribosomal protein S18 acetylase RimI-like enzyme